MKKQWVMVQILEVPDLTLTKYNTAGMRGLDSLYEFHRIFLRQWHRKGVLSGISVHLFYEYCPEEKPGNRLRIFLGFYGTEEGLLNVNSLVKSSALLSSYRYIVLRNTQIAEIMGRQYYRKCCTLTKKEMVVDNNSSEGEQYYTAAEWEPNEDGRLRQMYNLLSALDEPIALRIDLYPEDWHDKIRNTFIKQSEAIQAHVKKSSGDSYSKNQAADMITKSYDSMAKQLDGTPLFRANIFAFGQEPGSGNAIPSDDVELVLDTLASEAVKKGDYQIVRIDVPADQFNEFIFLDQEVMAAAAYDVTDKSEKIFKKCRKAGYELMSARFQTKILRFLPTVFSLEQLEPIFRLPVLDESDHIEIRKETAPRPVDPDGSLFLGNDDQNYPVNFPLKLLTKHVFIAGVPGSGKTNLMHHLTSSLWRNPAKRIPFLVFEPAKKEYRALLNQKGMEDVYLFSPNAAMTFPIHINPFEFPRGLMLSEHIRQLEEVFEGAFPLENPMPFLLDTAVEAVYRECGWTPDMLNDGNQKRKFPTMSMLYRRLEEELEKTTYSDEVSGNLKSALQVRIGSLLRREMGDIFDVSVSTFSPEEWLEKAAIIELEAMGSGPANFMTLLLCALIRESLKVHPNYSENHARHVIFIEEAHNLIGPTAVAKSGNEADPKQAATAFVVKMLAEVRALKESIVIADQLPTVMAPEIIKNTGLKIGLRITSSDDRELLCSTMSANAVQMEAMGSYDVGRALISYEGLKKPFEMQIHQWLGPGDEAYIEDDQLRTETETSRGDPELQRLVRERKSYQYMAEKSFRAEFSKLREKIEAYLTKLEAYSEHFRKMDKIIAARKMCDEKIVRELDPDSPDLGQELDAANADAERFQELLETYEKAPAYINSYVTIQEGFQLICALVSRKKHWDYLGLPLWEKKDTYIKGIKLLRSMAATAIDGFYRLSVRYYPDNLKRNAANIMEKIQQYIA